MTGIFFRNASTVTSEFLENPMRTFWGNEECRDKSLEEFLKKAIKEFLKSRVITPKEFFLINNGILVESQDESFESILIQSLEELLVVEFLEFYGNRFNKPLVERF